MFMCEKNLFETRQEARQAHIFRDETISYRDETSWAMLDRNVSPGNFCQHACCEHDFNVIAHIERSHLENNKAKSNGYRLPANALN